MRTASVVVYVSLTLHAYLCVIDREYLFLRVSTDSILEVEISRCVEASSSIADGVAKDHYISGRNTLGRSGQTAKQSI